MSAVSAEADALNASQKSIERWLGDQPGGVAAAYVDARGVTFFNAGKFSRDDVRAVTPDTEFEIGSVTKVFTALLLADSVAAGKATLEGKIGAPFAASEITYLQLATHTSGLPRLPKELASSDPMNPYAGQDLASLTQAFADLAPAAKPTEKSMYSNFGFAVLGQALAATWGEAYEAALRERVLEPLGLDDTFCSWREIDAGRVAPGHAEQGLVEHWDMGAYAPAGGLVSTTRDLAKFLQACLGFRDTPLKGALHDMAQPRVAGAMPGSQIGLAWIVEQRGASTLVWHNGATGGFRSFVGYDATKRAGVVVLTNHARSVDELGMALLAGRELPATKSAPAPSAAVAEYVGNYPLAPSFVIAITAEGDALRLQATNQPRLKLRELAKDRYAVEGVAAEVSFERGPKGEVVALVLHQHGLNQRAPRFAPGETPPAPKEVALSETELEAYVGEYRLGPATFTVKREGLRLMVQLTGQPFAQVFPSAKDEFFYKIVNAQISFVRGSDGNVAALVLHQNGRDQRAERVR